MYFMIERREVKRAPLITPPRTRRRIVLPLCIFAMPTETRTAANPKRNEHVCTASQVFENTIPSAAPKDAPARTPKSPGETRGFTNIA
ncbi:MAG: hypothetical protein A4E63_00990 [Syntrophorhabdus sp. PtaU1.Bin050]|nr:MAG: hypothetical protein A4E63_00990 [Syntrophorhabdus sp. PtaU1.Bin050]